MLTNKVELNFKIDKACGRGGGRFGVQVEKSTASYAYVGTPYWTVEPGYAAAQASRSHPANRGASHFLLCSICAHVRGEAKSSFTLCMASWITVHLSDWMWAGGHILTTVLSVRPA